MRCASERLRFPLGLVHRTQLCGSILYFWAGQRAGLLSHRRSAGQRSAITGPAPPPAAVDEPLALFVATQSQVGIATLNCVTALFFHHVVRTCSNQSPTPFGLRLLVVDVASAWAHNLIS